MNFNWKKNWSYFVFVIPYVIISLCCLLSPRFILSLTLNKIAISNFEIHRLMTVFFIDTSIISVVFTVYIGLLFFQFLGEVMTQVKIAITLGLSMICSSILFYFVFPGSELYFSGLSLFFTMIFLFTLGVALLLYRDEMMARMIVSRMWFIIFFEVYLMIRGGMLSILMHAIMALSVFVVLLVVYYFTEPKKGYML